MILPFPLMIIWDNPNLSWKLPVFLKQLTRHNWTQLMCPCWHSHQDVYDFVEKNAKELDQAIEYDRDLGYDYFGAFTYVRVCRFLFPAWCFCCSLLELGLFLIKKISFFEVSRPLRSPTFYACMVRLWNDLNIWSCVQLVVSIVVISMQLWKPMIWCPGAD